MRSRWAIRLFALLRSVPVRQVRRGAKNLRSSPHLSSLTLEAANALLSPLRSHLDANSTGVSEIVAVLWGGGFLRFLDEIVVGWRSESLGLELGGELLI